MDGATSDASTPLRSMIVIPARLSSTRLPRKLLLADTGKPLIQHTFEAASLAKKPQRILVATDSEEIADAVLSFGGQVEFTSANCTCGTERVAEIAAKTPNVDVLINVQGDEPEISASAIDLVVELLDQNPSVNMSTLAAPIRSKRDLHDPACVKLVFDQHYKAIYFSRAPIPFVRDWSDSLLSTDPPYFHRHIGIYAYRRDFLLHLARLPSSMIERCENLEQLRVIDAGFSILIGVINSVTLGIDTPDDYRHFLKKFAEQNQR